MHVSPNARENLGRQCHKRCGAGVHGQCGHSLRGHPLAQLLLAGRLLVWRGHPAGVVLVQSTSTREVDPERRVLYVRQRGYCDVSLGVNDSPGWDRRTRLELPRKCTCSGSLVSCDPEAFAGLVSHEGRGRPRLC